MSVLLYAITGADALPISGEGLGGRPLRALTEGELTAVVSDLDEPPRTDHETLWAYEQVVERLMAGSTVLPARFGATAPTDHELTSMLAQRNSEFTQSLARVRDAVEFAVRAPADARPSQHGARTGTGYMQRLVAQQRPLRQLDVSAAPLIRASQRTGHGHAYLVDRSEGEQFAYRARVLGLTITGPWPPYSFASGA
jgi:Gas vesicle synthesis protein GvpL/GvpF